MPTLSGGGSDRTMPPPAQASSVRSSPTEFLFRVPLVILLLLSINCIIHGIIFLLSLGLGKFAISFRLVVSNGQYYRIITSAFTHSGIMHIFMNMSSLMQIGPSLETQFGSLQFFIYTLWSIVVIGALYISTSWLGYEIFSDPGQLNASGVGYSGVLFAYAVVEANHTTAATQSVFGMFDVPSKMMPFLMLVALQVIIPGISWLGHLSGVIVGILTVAGFGSWLLPSQDFIEYMESIPPLNAVQSRFPSYVRCTRKTMEAPSQGGGGACGMIWDGTKFVLLQIRNVLATLLHIVGLLAVTERVCGQVSRGLIAACCFCWSTRRSTHEAIGSSSSSAPASGGSAINMGPANTTQSRGATVGDDDMSGSQHQGDAASGFSTGGGGGAFRTLGGSNGKPKYAPLKTGEIV